MPKHVVRNSIALAATLAATGLAGAGLAQVGETPANAATVKVAPATLACDAFKAFQDHPTARNLSTMIADAARLRGKSYLKADLLELAADASSPSKHAAKYVTVAEQYAGEDCTGGA